jgi:hypothetical protein
VLLHGVYGEGESLGIIATVDGRLGRIGKGSSVKGWRLESYADGVAVFGSDGRSTTLPLVMTTPTVNVASNQAGAGSENGVTKDTSSASEGDGQRPDIRKRSKPSRPKKTRGSGLTFGGDANGPDGE